MGKFKITMTLSIILAAVAAVVNLSAFVCVYNAAKEIVQSLGDFSKLNQAHLIDLGWHSTNPSDKQRKVFSSFDTGRALNLITQIIFLTDDIPRDSSEIFLETLPQISPVSYNRFEKRFLK